MGVTTMSGFPDQLHIDRIRTALWSRTHYGRATVMVGAGFSLNAQPISPSVPRFPTWADTTERLVAELYPTPEDRTRPLATSSSTSGALRLAEEYEAAFGREALEGFLLNLIPDTLHEPSKLHSLLVSLPWAEILTTNYDTLLERAASRGISRQYDVVRTAADIPGTVKPRIVKLHGSFPSTRPFIFTEEDFRTYPRRFAPFLNLAQQAAMETVLCLVGFSGDDPNFLNWTGWVRDNLGSFSPQIYLCGLLNLNTAIRNMLHDRHVVPVDLSPLFPSSDWTDAAERHSKAMEWLLLSLEAGRPVTSVRWPMPSHLPLTAPSLRLPLIHFPLTPKVAPENRSQIEGQPTIKEMESLVADWQTNRKLYPGWLVAPPSARKTIKDTTFFGLQRFTPILPTASLALRFQFLVELAWRLDKAAHPLLTHLTPIIDETLIATEPFNLPNPGDPRDPIASKELATISSNYIKWGWLLLSEARLRLAREDRDFAAYSRWKEQLQSLSDRNPNISPSLSYQDCLLALGNLDFQAVYAALSQWTSANDDPIWSLRRASILAEIGRLPEAHRTALQALEDIRLRIQPGTDDIPMYSREGWALHLVFQLQFAINFSRYEEIDAREEKLSRLRCDPTEHLDDLSANLDRAIPLPAPNIVQELTLTGNIKQSKNYNFGSKEDRGNLAAYEAFRLIEDAGYPSRAGHVTIGGALILRACDHLSESEPHLCVSNLLRSLDVKAVKKYFSVSRIALMSHDQIQELFTISKRAVRHGLSILGTTFYPETGIPPALEELQVGYAILNVLALRLSTTQVADEVKESLKAYGEPNVRSHHIIVDALTPYLKQLLEACDSAAIDGLCYHLLSLPVPGYEDEQPVDLGLLGEPLTSLNRRFGETVRDYLDPRWDALVHRLYGAAIAPEESVRVRALYRLNCMYRSKLLSESEMSLFATALWNRLSTTTRLPFATGMRDFSLLTLPEPEPGIALEAFRRFYVSASTPALTQKIVTADGRVTRQYRGSNLSTFPCGEIKGATKSWSKDDIYGVIDWTPAEARGFFESIES